MATNSAKVSLTREELVRLRDLQGAAWGHYTKAYAKLEHAINKIDQAKAEEARGEIHSP